MRQPSYLLLLALLLCTAVGAPIAAFVAYRRGRGGRGSLVGNCLWAAGYELMLAIPAAPMFDQLGWIPPDASIHDIASSVGPWLGPIGFLCVMLGLVLRPETKANATD